MPPPPARLSLGVAPTNRDRGHNRCGTPVPYAWEFADNGRWFEVAVKGPLIFSDRRLAVDAAIAGIGIALWSERFLKQFIDAGLLVPLLEEYSPPYPGFYLCYPAGRHPPAALRALIEVLREAFPA